MKKLFILVVSAIIFAFPAMACETNEIDVLGDGTQCETSKFEITTTNLTAGDEFKFKMSAAGVFYVDWGDGTIQTIDRTGDTTETQYTHTYTTSGEKTIRFSGLATGYNSAYNTAAIRFGNASGSGTMAINDFTNTPTLVASASGSLGAIFPGKPSMAFLFYGATNLTNIPSALFQGIVGSRSYMFLSAFLNCKNLSQIPKGLFDGVEIGYGLFRQTFYGCSSITSIPEGLFKDINGVSGELFYFTFYGCSSLQSIPNDLFAGIKGKASYVFTNTFNSCTHLTSIPENLFAGITGTGDELFAGTFYACSSLSGYIPPSTFAGLIANGSPTKDTMWTNRTFAGTQLATTCPGGTTQYITGYEDYWGGKVSCVDENLVCDAGEYFVAHGYECTQCPENSYCPGGTYPYSESLTQGITACATGHHSAAGSISVADCIANLINITWDHADSSDITANNAGSVTYGGDIRTPVKAQHINGKIFTGWVFNEPSGN